METYIPQLKRGMKTPSFDTLVYIANALDVTTDELLCDYIHAEKDVVATSLQKKLNKLTKQQQQHIEKIINLEPGKSTSQAKNFKKYRKACSQD